MVRQVEGPPVIAGGLLDIYSRCLAAEVDDMILNGTSEKKSTPIGLLKGGNATLTISGTDEYSTTVTIGEVTTSDFYSQVMEDMPGEIHITDFKVTSKLFWEEEKKRVLPKHMMIRED